MVGSAQCFAQKDHVFCSSPNTGSSGSYPYNAGGSVDLDLWEFIDERDAEDAERHFDGTVIGGRTITVGTGLVPHPLPATFCAHVCSDAAMRQAFLYKWHCLISAHTAGCVLQAGPQDTSRDGHRTWIRLQGEVSRWAARARCCMNSKFIPACSAPEGLLCVH